MLYRNQRAEIGFAGSLIDNFDLSDKKRENRSRKVEDCHLQALLEDTKTIPNRTKCLPSNWVFLK